MFTFFKFHLGAYYLYDQALNFSLEHAQQNFPLVWGTSMKKL